MPAPSHPAPPSCPPASSRSPLSALLFDCLARGDADGLVQAMRAPEGGGAEVVWAVAGVLDRVSEAGERLPEESPARQAHEALEQQVAYAAIKSLARAAREEPQALAAAYQNARTLAARDALCEAASGAGHHHPALATLLAAHLERNASVAALSWAQYGDPAGRPLLFEALKREVERGGRATADADASEASPDLGSLHVEALLEALEAFEPPLSRLWQARAEALVAHQRGRMGALRSLLQEPPRAARH